MRRCSVRKRRRLRLGAGRDVCLPARRQHPGLLLFAHLPAAHFGGQKQPQHLRLGAVIAGSQRLRQLQAFGGERLVHHRRHGFQAGRVELALLFQAHDVAVDHPAAEGHAHAAAGMHAFDGRIFKYPVDLAAGDVYDHFCDHPLRSPRGCSAPYEK